MTWVNVVVQGLLLGGLAVPLFAAALGRTSGRHQAAARGELSSALVDTLYGAPDLVAYGAMEQAVRRVERADAELTRRRGRRGRWGRSWVYVSIRAVPDGGCHDQLSVPRGLRDDPRAARVDGHVGRKRRARGGSRGR